MKKVDLLKDLGNLYKASPQEVTFLEMPELSYLMIDGQGDPNTSSTYQNSVQVLYSLAYAIKFNIKKSQQAIDFKVMPMEGLWWVDDMRQFSIEKKADWKWTMMILQPDFISDKIVDELRNQVIKKKDLPLVKNVRFEIYREGFCAQILHFGPYSSEGENIAKLHQAIAEKGLQRTGKHHEIYLNTPLKTAPEKLKTIIRQPAGK